MTIKQKHFKKQSPLILSLLLTLTFLLVNIRYSKAKIIKLYDSYHFYELILNPVDDLNKESSSSYQPSGYYVDERNLLGECSEEYDENVVLLEDNNNSFKFKADATIYSNYEETLSFNLQAEFDLISLSKFSCS